MMIRQFDVVSNPSKPGRARTPFLLCLQHDHLDRFKTRLMGALVSGVPGEQSRLHPMFVVGEQRVFLDPTDLAAIPLNMLKPPIENLAAESFRILAAIDLVLTGV